ncbi:MAG: carbohydrate kinase [bacterium]|nr:carbohydrate kinase [bacterium]
MDGTSTQTVIGLGELLWDCFADSRRPGGAPANVAFHSGQLGHRGVVCSRVGDDELGSELVEYLAGRGLEVGFIQRDRDHPTGRVTVDTSNPTNPGYTIHEHVAWDHLAFGDDLAQLARGAAAVCFGTLAQRDPVARRSIHQVLAAAEDALLVYDVNLRQSWYTRSAIEHSLQAARIVKLNGDEVRVLAGVLKTGSDDPAAFAAELRERFGVETVCITRGGSGSLVFGPGEKADVPGVKVKVADAVGAGDAFTAALISGCLRGWPLRVSVPFANAVGALVAGSAGAMPVLETELGALVTGAQQEADR